MKKNPIGTPKQRENATISSAVNCRMRRPSIERSAEENVAFDQRAPTNGSSSAAASSCVQPRSRRASVRLNATI